MPETTTAKPKVERNLLFGILAVQMDFIRSDALVRAMSAWVIDKSEGLGQILVKQGALSGERLTMLETLVQEHLKQHEDDPERSLAACSASSLRQQLDQIADQDLQASLAGLSTAPDLIEDVHRTRTATFGISTSTGQRFRVLRPHALGGLGQVSVAYDEELQREVALKEIQERHADDPESRARFVLEAEITGRLEHPGVVPVYGLGHDVNGRPYYAMRFIKGASLKEEIEKFHKADAGFEEGERALAFRKLLGQFLGVCNAIFYAHSRGILHRDLKPSNIMLGPYGETLVVDWGLAKPAGRPDPEIRATEGTLRVVSASGSAPERQGCALGTPQYMSPEQAEGKIDQLGPATDVYSLGATFYSLLTGKPPFAGPDVGLILRQVQRGDFLSPRQIKPDVPRPLEAICLKAMAVRPEDRYGKVSDLADDIEHWLADEPVSAYPEPLAVRARRWVGHHRTLVTATAATVSMAAVLLGGMTTLLINANRETNEARREAVEQAVLATEQAASANKARSEADAHAAEARAEKRVSDHQRYLAEIRLAERAWQEGRVSRMGELLNRLRPTHTGGEDLRDFEWHYLWRLFSSLSPTGHTRAVHALVFSPDGKSLATASDDKSIRLWDPLIGNFKELNGHGERVTSVAFSPDGKRLASTSADRTLRLWDTATGTALSFVGRHPEWVTSVAFSPDGKYLATGCWDHKVRLWNASNLQEIAPQLPEQHKDRVQTVAFSPDGKRLASGGDDKTVCLWDMAQTMQKPDELGKHERSVRSIAFSLDGKLVASASEDGTVLLWDIKTKRRVGKRIGHNDLVAAVAFSPDGRRLVTGSWDKTVRLWDVTGDHELKTLEHHGDRVYSVAFSPDGQMFATASGDKIVRVWDAQGERLHAFFGEYLCRVMHVASSPGARSEPKGVQDPLEFGRRQRIEQETRVLEGASKDRVNALAFSPNSRSLACASAESIQIWDIQAGGQPLALTGHGDSVRGLAFSPDGRWLASASYDKSVRLWDMRTRREHWRGEHKDHVTGVTFSPDGKLLATASDDRTVNLWRTDTGDLLRTLEVAGGRVNGLAFSPDGRVIAGACWDKTVRLWDTQTGEPRMPPLAGHDDVVLSVAFSPDGNLLASGSLDQTIRVWDVPTGKQADVLKGHTELVLSVAFAPKGHRLASASWDGQVKVWDTQSRQEVLSLRRDNTPVIRVAFSPDGNLLAGGGQDGTVCVWDASPLRDQAAR